MPVTVCFLPYCEIFNKKVVVNKGALIMWEGLELLLVGIGVEPENLEGV